MKRRIVRWFLRWWRVLIFYVAAALVGATWALLGQQYLGPVLIVALLAVTFANRYRRGDRLYLQRVGRLLHDQRAAWSAAEKTFKAQMSENDLSGLNVPKRFQSEHNELVSLHADSRDNGSTREPAERTRHATLLWQRTEDIRSRITTAAADEAERSYIEELGRRASNRQRAYRRLAEECEASIQRLIDELTRLTPTRRVATTHEALVVGYREYLVAVRAYHQANMHHDPRGALEAARQVVTDSTAVNEIEERLFVSR